jgi:hypothetical protein
MKITLSIAFVFCCAKSIGQMKVPFDGIDQTWGLICFQRFKILHSFDPAWHQLQLLVQHHAIPFIKSPSRGTIDTNIKFLLRTLGGSPMLITFALSILAP